MNDNIKPVATVKVHREIEVCGNCLFFNLRTSEAGECKANPPQVILVPTAGLDNRPVLQINSIFPPIKPDDWCGCFESENDEPPVNDAIAVDN